MVCVAGRPEECSAEQGLGALGKVGSRAGWVTAAVTGVLEQLKNDEASSYNAWEMGSRAAVHGGLVAGGGVVGGAVAGAAVGSVVPVIGTAIGGLIGGALGGMAGDAAADAYLKPTS